MNISDIYLLFSKGQCFPIKHLSEDKIVKLNNKLTECNKIFQNAPCTLLEETAENLINRYKQIYTDNNNDDISIINEQEENIFKNIDHLLVAGDKIIKLLKGLPEAAYHLSSMYEVFGIYNIALLWSYVSYKYGLYQSKENAFRLLLLINNNS